MKKVLLLGVAAVGVLLLGLVVGGCSSYNGFVAGRQEVNQAWAQVETVYQRRADLIPNLVRTVEGAAGFERSVLREVTEARASVGQMRLNPGEAPSTAEDLRRFQEAQGMLGGALSRLLVVAERYPDLKASAAFRDLQVQLEGTENRITVERQRFNDAVRRYNTRVEQMPGALMARLFNFQTRPYFQSDAGAATAPRVEFNTNPTPEAR